MKKFIYSFGVLTVLLSPATCTLDSSGNFLVNGEEVTGNQQQAYENMRSGEGDVVDIDPIIIRTKP